MSRPAASPTADPPAPPGTGAEAGPHPCLGASCCAPGDDEAQRLAGLRAGWPRVGPRQVHLDLVNRCNTRCRTCWHHSPLLRPEQRPDAAWQARQLARADFDRLLAELQRAGGLAELLLSGMGEPFLHPEILAMIAAAAAAGLRLTVITNGLALDVPALLAACPPARLTLLVSVCGHDAASWEAFHGATPRDGWARLQATLAALSAAGVAVRQVQVIDRHNAADLPAMVRFAVAQRAARLSVKLASLGQGTESLALGPEQQAALLAEGLPAARALADAAGLPHDLAAFASQLQPDPLRTAPIEQVGCVMGWFYARITVAQQLLYCCSTEVEVAQLGPQQDFCDAWWGGRQQALRRQLAAGRFFPGCVRCGKYKQNLKWAQRLGTAPR